MKNYCFRNNKILYQFILLISLIFQNFMTDWPVSQKNSEYCKVKIIAHRGAWKSGGLPQNSIESLLQAIKLHADGSEFDVRITADDSLVINHDREYNGFVIEKTPFSELVKFRLSNGEKLPTLREYITAGIKNNNHTKLICELKSPGSENGRNIYMAEKCVQLATELNAKGYISWISFDYEIVKRISELESDAEVFYLNGDISPAELKSSGINGVGYNYKVFLKKPEWIEEARKYGVLLNVWTVNYEEEMEFFIKKCFDYITTDEPEKLKYKIHYKNTLNTRKNDY